jgi:fructan beta-fructosidase
VDGFVDSYHPRLGTKATGVLTSAPFALRGDLLLFRIAGGNDPEKLHVDLLVGEVIEKTATGRRGDYMSRRSWDIAAFRGRDARLRVVDEATDDWGYIAVDEVVQWQRH